MTKISVVFQMAVTIDEKIPVFANAFVAEQSIDAFCMFPAVYTFALISVAEIHAAKRMFLLFIKND